MHRKEYLKPEAEELDVSLTSICTGSGIDPEGSGHDFGWGSDLGITPGGSGDDFEWGD